MIVVVLVQEGKKEVLVLVQEGKKEVLVLVKEGKKEVIVVHDFSTFFCRTVQRM